MPSLKGAVSRDFCIQFYHQTAPPGPSGDVLGSFIILLIFQLLELFKVKIDYPVSGSQDS